MTKIKLLTVVLLFCLPVFADEKIELYLIEYPPFTGSDMPGFGLSFNMLVELLEGSDVNASPVFLPVARLENLMKKGSFVASFVRMRNPPENIKIFQYQKRPNLMGLFRLSQPSPFYWDSLDELEGKRVASLNFQGGKGILQKLEDAGLLVDRVHSMDAAFKMLSHGRVEFVLAIEAAGLYASEQLNIDHLVQFSERSFESYPAFALSININEPQGLHLWQILNEKIEK